MRNVRFVTAAVSLSILLLAGAEAVHAQPRGPTRGRDRIALATAINEQIQVLKDAVPLPPPENVDTALKSLDGLLADFLWVEARENTKPEYVPPTVPATDLTWCQQQLTKNDLDCKRAKASLCRRCVCQGGCP